MPNTDRIAFWRRTPPALFPAMMGILGLGLVLRQAELVFDVPATLVWVFHLLVVAFYALFAGCYLAKTLARPAVVIEDLTALPGRAGLAAMSLGLLLVAAICAPDFPGLARILLHIGVIVHLGLAGLVIWVFWRVAPDQARVTPAWHLAFVGFIVAPLSAVPLGLVGPAQGILAVTFLVALVIYGISAQQLVSTPVPPPLRPLLAIHLAPVSLFGVASHLLGQATLAQVFAALALALAIWLVLRAGYLTEAGFSPLWGAFTFPLAAFTTLMLSLSGIWIVPGVIGLILALAIIPYIFGRVSMMWASGALAKATKPAIA